MKDTDPIKPIILFIRTFLVMVMPWYLRRDIEIKKIVLKGIPIILLIFVNFGYIGAQIKLNEPLVSERLTKSGRLSARETNRSITLQKVDNDSLINYAEEVLRNCSTCRKDYYGVGIEVNINFKQDAEVTEIDGIGTIWRLTIESGNAFGMRFSFDDYQVPDGSRLFFYNEEKSMVLGAFSSINNHPDRGFSTQYIQGNKITLEYFEPIGVGNGVLHLNRIIHAFKPLFEDYRLGDGRFGQSGSCMVDINCNDGSNFQEEKKAVTFISEYDQNQNLEFICTGFLINSNKTPNEPYLMTAAHCIEGISNGGINKAPETYFNIVVYFDYENQSCGGDGTDPVNFTNSLTGADLMTMGHPHPLHDVESDFALLKLINRPELFYDVFYLGWDRSTTITSGVVGISHPWGDVKKISRSFSAPIPGTGDLWEVNWDSGVTQPGSSGSPLLTDNGLVIGHLSKGESRCADSPESTANTGPFKGGPDYYGKISAAWSDLPLGGFVQSPLHNFLDPNSTGVQSLQGYNPPLPITALVDECHNTTFTGCKSTFEEFEPVYFRVTASGGIAPYTYVWNFGDGQSMPTSSPVVLHSYSSAGSYQVTVTITDNQGMTGIGASVTNIVPLITTPVLDVDFEANDTFVTTGDGPVEFNNTSTSNLDLTNASYVWYFGEGAYPQFAYSEGPHSICYDNQSPNKSVSLSVTLPGVISDIRIKNNYIYVQDDNLFACNAYDPGWVQTPGVAGDGYENCLFPDQVIGMANGDFNEFNCVEALGYKGAPGTPGICINDPVEPCFQETWFGSHGTTSLWGTNSNGRVRLWASATNSPNYSTTRLQSEGLVYQHFKDFKEGEWYRLSFKSYMENRASWINIMDHLYITLTSGLVPNLNCDNSDTDNFQMPQYQFQMYELGKFQYLIDLSSNCYEINFEIPDQGFDQIWIYALIEPTLTPDWDANGAGRRTGAILLDNFSLSGTNSPIGCPADVEVSAGDIVTNNEFQAALTIHTLDNIEILNGESLNLKSGQDIFVRPGFSALAGSSVNLTIEDCVPITNNGRKGVAPISISTPYLVGDHFTSDRFKALHPEDEEVDEKIPESRFRVYPNPTNGYLNIIISDGIDTSGKILISNVWGYVVETIPLSADKEITVDLLHLAPGMYFILWQTEYQKIAVKSFIKK